MTLLEFWADDCLTISYHFVTDGLATNREQHVVRIGNQCTKPDNSDSYRPEDPVRQCLCREISE
jgi:hypothetical protein